jgi:hypothetical protein
MKTLSSFLAVAATLLLAASPLQAQQQRKSPHETVSQVVDGGRVTITYGSPYMKGRKIWGGLVPYDKAWRMGADEATSLITQKPLLFGDTTIPAGAYTLYFVPNEDGSAKLAFCSVLGAWGVPVDEKNDVARVDAKKSDSNGAAATEQFTVAIDKGSSGGGVIKLMWEKTTYSIPFTVKK